MNDVTRILRSLSLAFLLTISTEAQQWKLRHELHPTGPGLNESSGFGRNEASALDGRIALVGHGGEDALCPNDLICNSGAAYVFDVIAGEQITRLTADRPQRQGAYGWRVAVSGAVGLVEQIGHESLHAVQLDNGEELLTLRPSNVGVSDFYGRYAIDGETVVFNSRDSGQELTQTHFFDLSTAEERLRVDGGWEVDIKGEWALISDPWERSDGSGGNLAMIVSAATGEEVHRLRPPSGSRGFGNQVSLSATTALVSTAEDVYDHSVFAFDVVTGEQIGMLNTGGLRVGDLDVDGRFAVVSFEERISENPRIDRWSASVFDVETGQAVFAFPSALVGSGGGVSIDGNTAIFTHEADDERGGVLYVATFGEITTPGDYNNNGIVEQADLDLVLLLWGEAASPIPDGWTSQLPLGRVDQDELDAVLLNWGITRAAVGSASVPEPSSLALVALLSVAALAVVRRGR